MSRGRLARMKSSAHGSDNSRYPSAIAAMTSTATDRLAVANRKSGGRAVNDGDDGDDASDAAIKSSAPAVEGTMSFTRLPLVGRSVHAKMRVCHRTRSRSDFTPPVAQTPVSEVPAKTPVPKPGRQRL